MDERIKMSIIMNYGCGNNCSYCIWKNHRLSSLKSSYGNFDFEYLKNILNFGKIHRKVSISGGGDPFFFDDKKINYHLLESIINLITGSDKLVSVHTRIRLRDKIIKKIYQMVVSYEDLEEPGLIDYLKYLTEENIRVRMAKVAINNKYNFERDIEFARKNNYRITFYAHNRVNEFWFRTITKNLRIEYSKLVLLSEGDQKVYFMPDNNIYFNYAATKLWNINYRNAAEHIIEYNQHNLECNQDMNA